MKLLDIILEDVELDEVGGLGKTNQEWLDEFKSKFPNWDYNDAVFFKGESHLKIKNVYCKIHKVYFPGGDESKGITVYAHLKEGGCYECAKDRHRQKISISDEEWKEKFQNNKKLKNKCDFKNIQFVHKKPLNYGPLVTNIYCKIHKKYFNGGKNNEGISARYIQRYDNVCPECIKNKKFENSAKSTEEWVDIFKSNKRNKNYDYSKSKIYYIKNNQGFGIAYVYNIKCNVKGLSGKTHGLYAKDGIRAKEHGQGFGQCPKCECENKQIEFLQTSDEKHKDKKYLYDKVDFCDDNNRIKKQGGNKTKSYIKVLIGCTNHKKTLYFFQDPYNHKTGQGCPICRESKGEKYISSILESKFKGKYKIIQNKVNKEDVEQIGNKRFDFYIPKLKVAIEYDGIQHFEPTFGSSEYTMNLNYNKTFTNDNIKNDFIKSNLDGIKLIRVPYTMEFSEINVPLFEAIDNDTPNQIIYLGNYPRRQEPKEPQSKFKINESKLSLMSVLGRIL